MRPLPGHYWASDSRWAIVAEHSSEVDGWQYAQDWHSDWDHAGSRLDSVRRRKWMRVQVMSCGDSFVPQVRHFPAQFLPF